MLENFKKITNPLTIVAIFAGIAEIMGTVSLSLVSSAYEYWVVLFLISFPSLLLILFFLTLNFNHRVLYAPSDYKDEANFMLASNLQPQQLARKSIGISGENRELEDD